VKLFSISLYNIKEIKSKMSNIDIAIICLFVPFLIGAAAVLGGDVFKDWIKNKIKQNKDEK